MILEIFTSMDGMKGLTLGNIFAKSRTKEVLGRCLRRTKNVGNTMCQWVLKQNGHVITRRTLRRTRPEELCVTDEVEANTCTAFDCGVKEAI